MVANGTKRLQAKNMSAKSHPPADRQKKPVKSPRRRTRVGQPRQEAKPVLPLSIIEALEFRRLFDASVPGSTVGPTRGVSLATSPHEVAIVVSARIAHAPEPGMAHKSVAHR